MNEHRFRIRRPRWRKVKDWIDILMLINMSIIMCYVVITIQSVVYMFSNILM